MHQTVRDFLLDPRGFVANSDHRLSAEDGHLHISTSCIQYLLHLSANFGLAGAATDVCGWTPEHFDRYVRYLNGLPLATYALHHLKYHIEASPKDAIAPEMATSLVNRLAHSPMFVVYLLENWARSSLNRNILTSKYRTGANSFRNSLLVLAARKGYSNAVGLLLAAGAKPDSQDHERRTALTWAAENGIEAMFNMLAEQTEMDINREDGAGLRPLVLAARNGHVAVVRYLTNQPDVDFNLSDSSARNPLTSAVETGQGEVVKLLLSNNEIGPNKEDKQLRVPISLAAEKGFADIVDLLLESRIIDINTQDGSGSTPLTWAAHNGHLAVVQKLLATGRVNVNASNFMGLSPLSWAELRGKTEIVQMLKKYQFEMQ